MPETRTVPYDGRKIRDLRERAGLTRVQLAERVGCHPGTLQNIEGNRRGASRVMVARIAIGLGVDLDVITRDEPMQVAS
ncbi:MAG UNVERIFIED_CONTAM: helix-turn-helix domain-containing protein [Thermobifida fusca]